MALTTTLTARGAETRVIDLLFISIGLIIVLRFPQPGNRLYRPCRFSFLARWVSRKTAFENCNGLYIARNEEALCRATGRTLAMWVMGHAALFLRD